MYRWKTALTALVVLFSLAVLDKESRAQTELVVNGSFETGDFSGWQTLAITGGGAWFVYSGTVVDGEPVLAPPDGTFAAATEQDDPDSNILLQDITVPPGAEVSCTAIVYLNNQAQGYVIGDGLTLSSPNQQMRIDIIEPGSDPFAVGAGVLEDIFETLPGDPNTFGYTPISFDLTPFAGTTVTLRVAVVVTLAQLIGAIDAVSCLTNVAPEVSDIPTLSEWGMIVAAGVMLLAGAFYAMKRRKASA